MYLICGEALYDVFIDPVASPSSSKISLSAKAGGSPHNVAIGLARLGCAAAFATEIASDTLGRLLESRLGTEGVDCRFMRRTGKATPLAMVDVDPDGAPRYSFHGLDSILFHPDPEAVKLHWRALVGIHVGSIPIVANQSSAALLELVTQAPKRILVSLDPNVRLTFQPDIERWRTAVEAFRSQAHLIKVSEEDLRLLYGSEVDITAVAIRWLAERCSLVVVTCGAAGARMYSKTAGQVDIPPLKVVVVDTVGAGDSFQAAMLAWLVENRCAAPAELGKLTSQQLSELGQFATHAASITCRHRGPEFPYRKALQSPR